MDGDVDHLIVSISRSPSHAGRCNKSCRRSTAHTALHRSHCIHPPCAFVVFQDVRSKEVYPKFRLRLSGPAIRMMVLHLVRAALTVVTHLGSLENPLWYRSKYHSHYCVCKQSVCIARSRTYSPWEWIYVSQHHSTCSEIVSYVSFVLKNSYVYSSPFPIRTKAPLWLHYLRVSVFKLVERH